jgi:CheY-like chemotaxis protein
MTTERCVMVVEDDRDVREAIAWVLEDAGYRVITAENGSVALGLLRDGAPRPSAIILDLMMPVMDGWQFRAAQASDPALADIPVICLTAHPNAERSFPELRPNVWIQKPPDLGVLLAALPPA